MKYEKGQFGEPWGILGGWAVSNTNGGAKQLEAERAVACVNALDGLDPNAVSKIADWWRANQHTRAELERAVGPCFPVELLDELIGVNDANHAGTT